LHGEHPWGWGVSCRNPKTTTPKVEGDENKVAFHKPSPPPCADNITASAMGWKQRHIARRIAPVHMAHRMAPVHMARRMAPVHLARRMAPVHIARLTAPVHMARRMASMRMARRMAPEHMDAKARRGGATGTRHPLRSLPPVPASKCTWADGWPSAHGPTDGASAHGPKDGPAACKGITRRGNRHPTLLFVHCLQCLQVHVAWACLGHVLDCLGFVLTCPGAVVGCFWPVLGWLGTVLGLFRACLGLCWVCLGLWAVLGLSWDALRAWGLQKGLSH
jgi:hypothetical protein